MLLINSSYVMAANPDNNFSKMEEKVDGKIYSEKGDVLNLSYIEFKSSCTHASGNRVTDTVWQHRHTGSRCDVYKANATWCKKCNTILKYNSAWVYSYTHYGCNANYAQTECQFRYCGTAIPFLTVRSTAR